MEYNWKWQGHLSVKTEASPGPRADTNYRKPPAMPGINTLVAR